MANKKAEPAAELANKTTIRDHAERLYEHYLRGSKGTRGEAAKSAIESAATFAAVWDSMESEKE